MTVTTADQPEATASAVARTTPIFAKLYIQVLIAVGLGALLGFLAPNLAQSLKPFGDAFIRAIRAVIAPRFGDIFRGNYTKAGLLPVVLPEATVAALQDAVEAEPATEIVVDLDHRLVTAETAGISASFEIDDYTRWRLMEGLDDIGLTLRHVDDVTAFEHSRPKFLPVTA